MLRDASDLGATVEPTTLKFVLGYNCGETSALGDYYHVATNVLGDHFVLFNSSRRD